ncbi:hypothetical protein B9D06_22060 [Mycobacterium tuberculosis]|nr:hypothetical protein B9D06_22060 [Mycobacterium tuberculosis]
MRTDGYLREYYRRQVRKFGGFRSPAANKKAIIAVAHKLIVIMNRPGMSGDSSSWKGWGHVRWFIEEVPAGAA